jgi:hypothetical protein
MSEAVAALGGSSMSEAFGANVQIGADAPGLCLVVGRTGDPSAAIAAAGGRLVTRLPGSRVLAMLTWHALAALRADRSIALAGAVTIDPERFARFCALAGIDGEDEPSTAPGRAREE